MPAPTDRYEPLPSLLGLPAYLLRKLSPRGRRMAAGLGVLLFAGAVAGAIVLVPQISESKREHAAAERQARIRAEARQRAQLIAEQRPRRGRVSVDREAAGGTRALIGPLERAITSDARARAARGELDNRTRRTTCRPVAREGARVLLSCTAITSEVETSQNSTGVVSGYNYRAAVSAETGRFAFCKSAGRALGFDRGRPSVALPRACGG
jgi:hypothetical protein